MKIWVCGAQGMLGSHFRRLLMEKKWPFVANDHQQIDITQLESVCQFVKDQAITHIINCAAYTHVDKAESEQEKAYLINAQGPLNLGIAAKRRGAHVLHFSTDYVFNGQGSVPYTEEHACHPINTYGKSKWKGEINLLNENQNSCIIRTSWLFGWPGNNFVEKMLHLMKEKKVLRVVSDQIGRPTYCQDLAEAALDLMEEKGIYHFANACETNWYQFAQEIYKQAKAIDLSLIIELIESITTHDYPTPAKRPAYSTLSTNKIEAKLGKAPRAWQEALADYLALYKHHQDRLP